MTVSWGRNKQQTMLTRTTFLFFPTQGRDPNMTFVQTPIGLENVITNETIILESCHSSCLSTVFNDGSLFNQSLIPSLWELSGNTFYHLVRQCSRIQTNIVECHEDLVSDNSHRIWIGLTNRLFELSQLHRERVWDFASQLTIMFDFAAVLSLPSVSIKMDHLRSFLSNLELCFATILQFSSFLETSGGLSASSDKTSLSSSPSRLILNGKRQQSVESSLIAVLNHFSGELHSLLHSLSTAPDIRLMSKYGSSPTVRLTLNSIGSIASALMSMKRHIACLFSSRSSDWSDFFGFILKQSVAPLSARLHFCRVFSELTKTFDQLFGPHACTGHPINLINEVLLLSECFTLVKSRIKESKDFVSSMYPNSVIRLYSSKEDIYRFFLITIRHC